LRGDEVLTDEYDVQRAREMRVRHRRIALALGTFWLVIMLAFDATRSRSK
jgi:hypothetical protein